MIKIYESSTLVSNLTVFVQGKPVTLNFVAVSPYVSHSDAAFRGTCSRLETANESVQNAIERHRMFGSTIRLVGTKEVPSSPTIVRAVPRRNTEGSPKVAAKPEPAPTVVVTANADGTKTVKVSCPQDARDYLAQNYGIDPKKLGLTTVLKSQAKKLGIVFQGI